MITARGGAANGAGGDVAFHGKRQDGNEATLPGNADLSGKSSARGPRNCVNRGRRSTESRAETEKMKAWVQGTTALKTASLGGAVRYTLGIWSRLTLFLDAGRNRGRRQPD